MTPQGGSEGAEAQLHKETANDTADGGNGVTRGPKIAEDVACVGHSEA